MMTAEVPTQDASRKPRVTVPGTRYHRIRKAVQSVCVLIFILLPLTDAMRVDIPRQRFYFFGAELWISEFAILFLTMMFFWILVAAMAMIYGRFYCGYLCPQMIFSETAMSLERAIGRAVSRRAPHATQRLKKWVTRIAFYTLLLPASVFVTFVFVSFFVPPADLFHRLMTFDIRTAGGIVGASVTLLTFLDFAFLRQRFCTTICPYGYLQNMLADRNTLLVHFHDPNQQCIRCEKCVRACPMGIDIRQSSHQLECTHCAECIDACSAVLGRLGRPPMVQYAWGETHAIASGKEPWYRRIGLRDGKRIAVLVLLLIYATGLSIAIGMRKPVLVQVMPKRETLYSVAPNGRVLNHFRILLSNRSHGEARVSLTVSGLNGAAISGLDQGVTLQPAESLQREFDVAAPAGSLTPGMNHLRISASVLPEGQTQSFDENFFAPFETEKPASAGEKRP